LLALAAATLAVLIAVPARAQQAAPPVYGQPAPDATPMPNQSRQRYVPQHIARDGQYVPPHYEAPKTMPFRGHFAAKEAARAHSKQRGYKEPAPAYTTPDSGQRIEGQ
jgi:hypothetical protein